MQKELWKGNEAIAEAAIRAGCKCFFGYPITPQNEIPEYMSMRMPKTGGVFVQSESEVAAINMVYGAAATGVRAMTSSSSPGVSLKQEGISYMAGAAPFVLLYTVFYTEAKLNQQAVLRFAALLEFQNTHQQLQKVLLH